MKVRSGKDSLSANIMTPSWLKVERAIIFFISISCIAIMPAIIIVIHEISIIELLKSLNLYSNGLNRSSKKTPAVTSVEEWTRADTGVGAAMAAGSQAEKGI